MIPRQEEGPGAFAAGAEDLNHEMPLPDCGTRHATQAEPLTSTHDVAKQFATLQDEFALAGFELVSLADGTLLASRWGMFKPLPDVATARLWLRHVGGLA